MSGQPTESNSASLHPRIINGGGLVPDFVEFRRCPKDPFHWKTEGNRCPVCRSKIEVSLFIYAGVVDETEVVELDEAASARALEILKRRGQA